MQQICPKVKRYIETEILPRYDKLPGHAGDHITSVIQRSLKIAEMLGGDIDVDKVYVIAAYHDLGREIDDETHNKWSAYLLRRDKTLAKLFPKEDIEIMAQAVEDHRASLSYEPRSLYGKIVSSADRSHDINEILARAWDYNGVLCPYISDDERCEMVRKILRKKYSPNGYAANRIYFLKEEYLDFMNKVEEITRNPTEFRKIQLDFNRRRAANSSTS